MSDGLPEGSMKRRRSSPEINASELADDPELRSKIVPKLRQHAREVYLTKREVQEVSKLRHEIAIFESQLRHAKPTRAEIIELNEKKQLLALIQERQALETDVETYRMPASYIDEKSAQEVEKKYELLYKRYDNDVVNKNKGDDSAKTEWERENETKEKLWVADKPAEQQTDDYEFVLDPAQNVQFELDGDPEQNEIDEELRNRVEKVKERVRSIEETRKSLPVYSYRDKFLAALKEHQVLIVLGETGSGKTTQLPQYLYEAGYTADGKKVGCTQPRRVAAMSVAARVAEETGTRLGQKVGYSIRFEDRTSDQTLIKYMTDGVLLREFLNDPELSSYSALMIDEAHERTLNTDILFALVKDVTRYRPDLKLLIASATLDAAKFSAYFDDAPIFKIPGRPHHVDIFYASQPEANYLHACVTTVFQIHVSQGPGDILVFLTGEDEIENVGENIRDTAQKLGSTIMELIVCPIYAGLPSDQQAKIFEPTPPNARKVVLATNIAETSITIDGIVYVIDSGFAKENVYNPYSGMESLIVNPISRAAANQRAGRAGRVTAGKCFRLYTKWAFYNEMPESTTPEILRANLSSVILNLIALGIRNLIGFDFLDKPATKSMEQALELLYALGALNHQGELTKTGRQMAEFPAEPMMAKTLISATEYHCLPEVLSIVSMLSESHSLFYRPRAQRANADIAHKTFMRPGGDHIMLLEIWNQWVQSGYSYHWAKQNFLQPKTLARVRNIRDQFAALCDQISIRTPDTDNVQPTVSDILKAFTSGYFPHASRLLKTGEEYKTVKKGQIVYIHPSSILAQDKPKWVIYHELVLTTKEFMRMCIKIEPEWLYELAPHYYEKENIKEIEGSSRKTPKLR
ncbi:hypothetical protein CANCADRAFT_108233 [Tortispora caseinolytica NRRL Y-17796]|uniref:RNA helicase n=1 Tax=Tortispora caseinolytica NRRL Y-17796 TaxID=767744 RepID=A0A1E4TFZ5_9ASCO|nr:hypothetical protein CANCADRAFT_108233 [Tortispora caseinolytica NRRL Y-17796]